MHKGRLIVLESGTDASGKATQSKMLYERLLLNYRVRTVRFPNYESDSSGPVKMYLRGDFGCKPDDVNPFAASTFYAVDRFASYAKDWRTFYNDGGVIIADRYTTSNMVHQAAKLKDSTLRTDFLNWLTDLEFNKLGLPKPDIVFFLNVLPEISWQLMQERQNQQHSEADIHEADKAHLAAAYNNACQVAKLYEWQFIECVSHGVMRTVADIHEEIYEKAIKILNEAN